MTEAEREALEKAIEMMTYVGPLKIWDQAALDILASVVDGKPFPVHRCSEYLGEPLVPHHVSRYGEWDCWEPVRAW